MPVSGVPDPDKHWRCSKCEQWFESDEGQVFEVERFSFSGQLADSIRGGPKMRFRCASCSRSHSRNRLLFWGIIAAVVVIAMAYQLWYESRFS